MLSNVERIRGSELNLIKNYLSNRKQYIELNSCKKKILGTVEHGVLQGSDLGPLLLTTDVNLYIFNLDFYGKIYMYADDICVIYPYKHEIAQRCSINF